jgi:SAM-dependent methyltransferase/Tfp pilus assembly protein PilF
MNRKQRRLAQSRSSPAPLQGAAGPAGARLNALLAEASAHLQASRLGHAAACLEQVLILAPDSADNHNMLGLVLAAAGQPERAAEAFRRALALDPRRYATNRKRLGDIRRQQGCFDQAAGWYRQSLATSPDDADVHAALGSTLRLLGQWDEAAAHCERALAIKPALTGAALELAAALISAGRCERALHVLAQTLRRQETSQAQSLFVWALKSLQAIAQVDDDVRAFAARALSTPWARPEEIMSAAIAIVKAAPCVADVIDRATRAWPQELPADQLLGPDGLAALAADRVLLALIENAKIAGIEMERFLTQLRRITLDAAIAAPGTAASDGVDALALFCALARQCHISEYAFAVTDREADALATLRQRLAEALASGAPVPAHWLAVFAAYSPLHELQQDDALLARSWPTPVDELLTRQVREPRAERELRGTIQQLTPIVDVVSAAVRRQYEDNPYPRWVRAAPVGAPCTIDAWLRERFPDASFRDLGKTSGLDILIAGCGTGQVAIEHARKFAGYGRVLAIDLSLTSLCYAKSKSLALGLDNIEYGQADLLALPSLGRSFDVINASGVLHHLADPPSGWRALLSCLRSDGFMCIGLYSEIARRDVVAARRHIAERGYGSDPDDIRHCRQEIMAAPGGSALARVAGLGDFFGLSNCRDLLFHVQEHRLSLPALKSILAELGLDLIGFNLPPSTLRRYEACYAQDRAKTDLDRWHQFEQDHPDTFAGMYQFWVQRRPPAG